VDDGSTDDTARILQKYATLSSIKIISQHNRGVSGARNTGLDAAVGQYIFFLDADDFVEPGSFAILLDKAFVTDADIVDGSWRYIANKRITPQIYPDRSLKLSGIYPLWHNDYAWGKLMKRTLWKRVRFPDPEGAIFEESILPYLIHAQCASYASVANIVVNYCGDNPHSITRTMRGNLKTLWMFNDLFDFLAHDEKLSFTDQLSDWAIVHCSAMLLIAMGHFGDDILHDVFVVAKDILSRHNLLREKPGRKYLNGIVRAFCESDFAAWKTLARYY